MMHTNIRTYHMHVTHITDLFVHENIEDENIEDENDEDFIDNGTATLQEQLNAMQARSPLSLKRLEHGIGRYNDTEDQGMVSDDDED